MNFKSSVKPKQIKYKTNIPRHIIATLLKTESRETFLVASREKKMGTFIRAQ